MAGGPGYSSKNPTYVQPVDASGSTAPAGVTRGATSGGLKQAAYISATAGTGNPAAIKGSAGQVYSYNFANLSTAWRYLHFYDKAAAPVPGTDTAVRVVAVPAGGVVSYNGTDIGVAFANGIGIAVTTAPALADGTVSGVGANDIVGMVDYL